MSVELVQMPTTATGDSASTALDVIGQQMMCLIINSTRVTTGTLVVRHRNDASMAVIDSLHHLVTRWVH